MTLNLDKTTWTRVAFGDVVKNVNETVRDHAGAGIDRIIAMEHMDPGELRIARWGSTEDGTTFTRRVKPGQTLFGKRRAYQRKVAYAEFEAICSGDIYTFEADAERLLGEFLPFLVQSDPFFDHALGTSAGSLSPRTNWRDLAKFEFDLPPLDEQKRIVELLWSVERSANAAVSTLLQLERARSASLDFALAGPGSSNRAPQVFGELIANGKVKVLTGPFGTAISASDYAEDGVPVVNPTRIGRGGIEFDPKWTVGPEATKRLARWALRKGDLVMMRVGDIGRCAVVAPEQAGWIMGTNTLCIRVEANDIDPYLIQTLLQWSGAQEQLRKLSPGTTMASLSQRSLARLLLPIGTRHDQMSILRRVQAFDHAQDLIRDEVAHLAALRAGISACVFGGK